MPSADLRPFAVLIVEDDEIGRELLVEHFQSCGFEAAGMADGPGAIAAIQRAPSRFGLILTDLQLPGSDGLTVLKAAKAANPSCYVVIITGYASLDSAIQAVRLGAYDYLTKPFSLGQIDVIIERVSDRVALETENRQLSRRLSAGSSGELRADLAHRLDLIESRLGRIESLLARGGSARDRGPGVSSP